MCRNIKTLFNYEPPADAAEIRSAAQQYVRKLSGFSKPSKINEAAFDTAIENIASASERLLRALQTQAPAKNREIERDKAIARNKGRFAS